MYKIIKIINNFIFNFINKYNFYYRDMGPPGIPGYTGRKGMKVF